MPYRWIRSNGARLFDHSINSGTVQNLGNLIIMHLEPSLFAILSKVMTPGIPVLNFLFPHCQKNMNIWKAALDLFHSFELKSLTKTTLLPQVT